jgi:hypothetical protein
MNKIRIEIANTLSKYASFVYNVNNPFRIKLANWLFKLADKISPYKK